MANEIGRKPDFKFRYLNKVTDEKGYIGVGWLNEDGSISVKLNDMVTLRESKDLILTLFLDKYKKEKKVSTPTTAPSHP